MRLSTQQGTSSLRQRPLPLKEGERLDHAEFMKRYLAMPEWVRAERIEGIVHMPAAAVSAGFHGTPHVNLATWLGVYKAMTPGVDAADNSTIELDTENDPQPDLCLYVKPESGGRVKFNDEKYIVGSPELIIEVAASSVSFDLGTKLQIYLRNQVKEYLVLRTYDGELDWFVLRDGQYQQLLPQADGICRSESFAGFWMNVQAMTAGDLASVLDTLRKGGQTAEHEAFVNQLAGK